MRVTSHLIFILYIAQLKAENRLEAINRVAKNSELGIPNSLNNISAKVSIWIKIKLS